MRTYGASRRRIREFATVAVTAVLIVAISVRASAQEGTPRQERIATTVTIYRDTYGVPHIFGPTDAAVMFGLAYCQAEDNFWQVEDNYIRAIGRATEIYGEQALPADLADHALAIPQLALAEYQRTSPQMRKLYDAFADGLNYFLATNELTRPRLLNGFRGWYALALYRFMYHQNDFLNKTGITPKDVLGAITEARGSSKTALGIGPLGGDWNREAAAVKLGSRAQTFTAETRSSKRLRRDIEAWDSPGDTGSNAWAIAPSRSASGRAMLFINPHQP